MTRVLSLSLAVSLAIGVGAASAQGAGSAGSRLYLLAGAVKTVSASSFTLQVGSREVVIAADSSTRVVAKGRASDLLYRYGRPKLTDVIKADDRVTVICRRSDAAPYAVEVRVVRR